MPEQDGTPKRRLTARDFDPEVLRLFDQYVHGQLDRRGFLEAAAKFAAAGITAAGLLETLSPRFAEAQQVPPEDTRIATEYIEIPSPQGYGTVRGYLAHPGRHARRLPAVLVAHENRGLNPHIEDIARRLAVDGFLAFAPDALFPLGGYPGDEDRARELFGQLDQTKTQEDFVAAANYVHDHPRSNHRLGVVGFCYGGGIANLVATRVRELDVAVPFYGNAPDLAAVPSIRAELVLHFAETDERINAAWPAYEVALQAAGVSYQAFFYPGTQHGFNNDTTPRYDEAAAQLAWSRTIAAFNQSLKHPSRRTRLADRRDIE